MANDLTGDFDVVAEFTTLAVDRALAAMHRCERLLHSMTARVDDIPPRRFPWPVIVGAVDTFGEVVVNQRQVKKQSSLYPGSLAATDAVYAGLDVLVNAGSIVVEPLQPSNLQGVAQLQLDPPTIEVPDASGSNLTVRMGVRARYFPDPNTSPAAQFVRGQLVITAPVNQVASQHANVSSITLNITGSNVNVNFNALYSSPPLSASDLMGINQLIRNALRTGFLPSNSRLPANVAFLQFRTLPGAPSVVGALMNLGGPKGHPATVNGIFLAPGDDFGFAISADMIQQKIQEEMQITAPTKTFYSYKFTVDDPAVELQNGRIVLSVSGHAHSDYLPDFNFKVTQAFTLNLAATNAGGPLDTAELAVSGDFSVDVTGLSIFFDWIASDFAGSQLDDFRSQRDAELAAHKQDIEDMFSVNKVLGGFLKSLLNPAQTQPAAPPQQDVNFTLAYRTVEIRPTGIIMHGSLGVTPWPAAHVEYQPIPTAPNTVVGNVTTFPQGPDYTALKAWIPGGAITEYDWSYRGQSQPFHTDVNRFVLLGTGGLVNEPGEISAAVANLSAVAVVSGVISGYEPLCLTLKGTRVSASGPVVSQPVTATVCGYNSFPIINAGNLTLEGAQAMVALTHVGADGGLQVVGHTPALTHVDKSGKYTPNVVAHFADDGTSANLDFLVDAVKQSGRKDAATAVLGLMTHTQLTKTRHTPGVIYGDRQGGGWERAFGVKTAKHPLTLIVLPSGEVAWQQEGPIDSKTLAEALKKALSKGGSANRGLYGLNLRPGRKAPNFLFELAEAQGLTLRKLEGRAVVLAFWRSTSKPSMDAIHDLQESIGKSSRPGPVVLAINDGETAEVAKKAAASHKLAVMLVTDPQRLISSAYGVSVWPTVVSIDASGVVTGIRYGRSVVDTVIPATGQKPAGARSK
jgi:peroxiredoxin